jgi:hypothetical protein
MPADNLIEVIQSLTPDEQESVKQFIEFLKAKESHSPFLGVVPEFIEQHPNYCNAWRSDLLR